MATSSGSLETSANSRPPLPPKNIPTTSDFSFSSPFMSTTNSFSNLLAADVCPPATTAASGRGLSDRIAERIGSGVPKFKSIQPPSLPLSPPPVSPSAFFAIPPGLSPAELLDSPVLLSTSNILPSPTTGTFPVQSFNWKNNSINDQQGIKQEYKSYSGFTFQPQAKPPTSGFESHSSTQDVKSMAKPEFPPMQSFSPEIASVQTSANSQSNGGFQSDYHHNQSSFQTVRENRKSDDGYNWRKYGQKQVKGSENPRSYYKCTYPNCPTKKKVERSLDGQITEIVYKGNHNHSKPQNTRRSSSSSVSSQAIQVFYPVANEVPDHSFVTSNGNGQMDSATTPENSSISVGDDDFDRSSQRSRSGGDEFDDDKPDAKRWKMDGENEGISAPGSRTVREPRVVVQTTSDIDILDDGYRWRKYGQKVVKGNPNPRSYYKCTHRVCPVRKHVERAAHDLRAVITTYEGKHNHDVPAARGSGNHNSINMPFPTNTANSSAAMAIRPLAMANPIRSSRLAAVPDGQAPYTQEMLEGPGSFWFSGFGNPVESYVPQQLQLTDNVFPRAKEEPRDDTFLESLLC